MNSFRRTCIAVLACVAMVPQLSLAEGNAVRGGGDKTYAMYVYYDSGAVLLDRDHAFPYDILNETYRDSSVEPRFKGVVIDHHDLEIASFLYNPGGEEEGKRFIVKAPYFPIAATVRLFGKPGTDPLSVSVAETSVCNQDRRCSWNYGEDAENCPSDCAGVAIPSPQANISTEPSAIDNIKTENTFWDRWTILAAFALLGVLAALIVVRGLKR